jgi:hypothetical protein
VHSDAHQPFREAIDQAMVTGLAQDPSLQHHLQSCTACQGYLSFTQRAIAGLGSFAFEVDASHHARMFAALEQRAKQLQPATLRRKRWGLACAVACALTLGGSLIDLQFGGWLAALLHVPGWQARQVMMAFWIVPSCVPLLLLPLLPLLSRQKERAL